MEGKFNNKKQKKNKLYYKFIPMKEEIEESEKE